MNTPLSQNWGVRGGGGGGGGGGGEELKYMPSLHFISLIVGWFVLIKMSQFLTETG